MKCGPDGAKEVHKMLVIETVLVWGPTQHV